MTCPDNEVTKREADVLRAALIAYRHNGAGASLAKEINEILRKIDATEEDRARF